MLGISKWEGFYGRNDLTNVGGNVVVTEKRLQFASELRAESLNGLGVEPV